jgi:hypothetical protein
MSFDPLQSPSENSKSIGTLIPKVMSFDPLQSLSENSKVHWILIFKVGAHLGVWGSILSHFPKLSGA